MSHLTFTYIKNRPMLMAKLGKDKTSARYFEFLIDSGADYTLIPKSAATILGIDYNKIPNQKTKIETANLQSIQAKKIKLFFIINDIKFKIPVLISEEEGECLLGRKGIFENFNITFKEKDQEVIFDKN